MSTYKQKSFSPELIARAQKIFEKRSGRAVSEEETERHLEKLADFGLLAVKVYETKKQQDGKEVKSHG